jgi:hypothetical protein
MRIFSGILVLVGLGFLLLPTRAAEMNKTLAEILKGIKAKTEAKEDAKDTTTTVNLGFEIDPGGALVLTEVGQLKDHKGGLNGMPLNNNAAQDNKDGTEKKDTGSISDVLSFPAGKEDLTLYTDPEGLALLKGLSKDDLAKQFGTKQKDGSFKAYIAYVEEGRYFDERDNSEGYIVDDKGKQVPDIAVYIRFKKGVFTRAFIVRSDTGGTELIPEPSAYALLAIGCCCLVVYGWRCHKRKVKGSLCPPNALAQFQG